MELGLGMQRVPVVVVGTTWGITGTQVDLWMRRVTRSCVQFVSH